MFTFTHPFLIEALIQAHLRGVAVDVVMDQGQSEGPNKECLATLLTADIPVRVNVGSELLHHKFALIDDKLLVIGSANWTKAAFTKNDECFLVLHDLSLSQREKMRKLWHIIIATSRPVAYEQKEAA